MAANRADAPLIPTTATEERAIPNAAHTNESRQPTQITRKPVAIPRVKRLDNGSSNKTRSSSGSASWLSLWFWELCACIIAVAALVAVVVTLHAYAGKPLRKFTFDISLNSVISIYTVVIKAALSAIIATGLGQLAWVWFRTDRPLSDLVTFDTASRGIWGCIKLIWHVNIHQSVALLGAVLALVSVAIDPFVQQLIRYVGCSTTLGGQTFVMPRTNMFVDYQHDSAATVAIPSDLQSAVSAGIFGSVIPLPVTCLTGNCTASDYTSLGYCSSCEDMSDLVTFQYWCSNGQNSTVVVSDPSQCSDTLIINSTITNSASMLYSQVIPSEGANAQSQVLVVSVNLEDEFTFDILAGKTQESIAHTDPFSLETFACTNQTTNSTWPCKGYGAARCSLWPCVRSYAANMSIGVLNETETARSPGPSDFTWGWTLDFGYEYVSLIDLECVTVSERQQLIEAGYHLETNDRWLGYNVTTDPRQKYPKDAPFPQSLFARQCVYTYEEAFDLGLGMNYLRSLLNGTLVAEYSDDYIPQLDGSIVLQRLWQYGQVNFNYVSDIANNISLSITNYMRQNGQSNNSASATGTVNHYATCVHVEWAWIALPAFVVFMAIVFCFLVIGISAVRDVNVWKSSPLTMVFCGPYSQRMGKESGRPGLSGSDQSVEQIELDRDHEPPSTQEMADAAKGVVVNLAQGDSRLRVSDSQVRP